jgi:MraZ protein
MLPEALVAHAALTAQVEFLGFGRIFHIWEPAAGTAFRAAARDRAFSKGTLPSKAAAQ